MSQINSGIRSDEQKRNSIQENPISVKVLFIYYELIFLIKQNIQFLIFFLIFIIR